MWVPEFCRLEELLKSLNRNFWGFQVTQQGRRGLLMEEEEAWTPQELLSTASMGGSGWNRHRL